jgi:hypothetical protein
MTPTPLGLRLAKSWQDLLPGPLAVAIAAEDQRIEVSRTFIHITADWLREQSEPTLLSLGVAPFKGELTVRESGDITSSTFKLRLTFTDPSGNTLDLWQSTTHPSSIHPWLRVTPPQLLPHTLVDVIELAKGFPGQPRLANYGAAAALQALATTCPQLKLEGQLATRILIRANTLRLLPSERPDDSTLLPEIGWTEKGVYTPSPVPVESLDAVLGAAALQGGTPRVNQSTLILAADLARNTLLARVAAVHGTPEEKRRFRKNPRAFLPDETAFDEADYSARVLDFGAPEPVPGDAQESTQDWAPEIDGLLLSFDTEDLWVPRDDLADFEAAVQEAHGASSPTFTWDGRSYPLPPGLAEALHQSHKPPARPTTERPPVLILRIKDNTLTLNWDLDLRPRPVAHRPIPATLTRLQAHQIEGLKRLTTAWERGEPGALLCDDMGLGKTLQAMVFAAWVSQNLTTPVDIPLMVVAPPSLLHGWLAELDRHLPPHLLSACIWGQTEAPPTTVHRQIHRLSSFLREHKGAGATLPTATVDAAALRATRPSLLLIGYDTLRRLQFAIGRLKIGLIIADEAQEAKDPASLRSRALRAMNQDFRLALTGTPIENSWRDLWTLCDFAVPGRLGTLRDFSNAYPSNGDTQTLGKQLSDHLAPVLIRRVRQEALQGLPPLTLRAEFRSMPLAQSAAYQAQLLQRPTSTGILGLLQGLGRISLHPRPRAELLSHADANTWARERPHRRSLGHTARLAERGCRHAPLRPIPGHAGHPGAGTAPRLSPHRCRHPERSNLSWPAPADRGAVPPRTRPPRPHRVA